MKTIFNIIFLSFKTILHTLIEHYPLKNSDENLVNNCQAVNLSKFVKQILAYDKNPFLCLLFVI